MLAVAVGFLALVVIILAVAVITEDESDEAAATTTTDTDAETTAPIGFQNGEALIVFLHPAATEPQIEDVRALLASDERVEEFSYCDQTCAYEEFQRLFSDDPALVESTTADILPASFRVEMVDEGASAHELGDELDEEPGVREVAYPPN